jgi:hypothetical protein
MHFDGATLFQQLINGLPDRAEVLIDDAVNRPAGVLEPVVYDGKRIVQVAIPVLPLGVNRRQCVANGL